MFIQTAFNFSSVVQRLVCRFSGLRLVALRWFVVFLASGPRAASASSYFFGSAAPPRWRCAFRSSCPSLNSGYRFWLLALTFRSSRPAFCGRLTSPVSTTETQLYSSPCLFKRHSVSQALFSAGFVVSPGFACWRCVLQALRCLGGAALFHSSRPSSNSSYRFWLLALTFRSSRPAYGGRLTSPVSRHAVQLH